MYLVVYIRLMHRFYISAVVRTGDEWRVDDRQQLHQWRHVLRFRAGERIVLFGGDGKEDVVEFIALDDALAVCRVIETRRPDVTLHVPIVLAPCMLQHADRFEFVLQKGTELGVSEFFPVQSRRTEARALHKKERLERIIVEAVEQCGGVTVPVLHEPMKFAAFVESIRERWPDAVLIVPHVDAGADFGATKFPASELITLAAMSAVMRDAGRIIICIGPEGGFDDAEVAFAREHGAHVVSLGRRVLRAETASIAAVTLVAAMV